MLIVSYLPGFKNNLSDFSSISILPGRRLRPGRLRKNGKLFRIVRMKRRHSYPASTLAIRTRKLK